MDIEKEKKRNEFKLRIYKFIIRLLKFLAKIPYNAVTNEIKKQVTRSGTSMGANYFEARGASSKKDFCNFFTISLKSANETIYWLLVVKSINQNNKLNSETERLYQEVIEISRILGSSVLTLKGRR